MKLRADYVVFGIFLLVIPFIFGMGIGRDQARHQIATVCEPQPGAVLVSSYQDPRGTAISCAYLDNMPTARQLRRAAAVRSSI